MEPAGGKDQGFLFNIQSYSVHDGPGIRTILFLKGCPLRCFWCCNPESQNPYPEVGYSIEKCLGCGRCVPACPQSALLLTENGVKIDRERCTPNACGHECHDACPSKALIIYGYPLSAVEALDRVERDTAFYARSGGGLTLSGGEPFSQPRFLMELLREAEKRAINVAVETCGMAAENAMLQGCALVDYLLFDIKHLDPAAHERATGFSNSTILRNVRSIRAAYPALPIHIRTPVIPGVNDTKEAVRAIAAFAAEIGAIQYELLPHHRMGEQKYLFLGRTCPEGQAPDSGSEPIDSLREVVREFFPDEGE